ncbi:transglycosylase SLT domain-containing protein [Actinopolymorpha sp. B11F2]|uniref:aggregation-promoting factor C-terminal-like domain-containing protein n=1 Tax=Actinopolymorpha sp. B11F2 TaxID=3160862 RepID=UPI0032E50935
MAAPVPARAGAQVATKPATRSGGIKAGLAKAASGPAARAVSRSAAKPKARSASKLATRAASRRPSRLSPTFAAMTAASIGVTGAVGGGVLISSDQFGPRNTLVLSDVGNSGILGAKKAPKRTASPTATPRASRTVTPTPTPTEAATPATGQAVLDRTAIERIRAEERASRARERLALSDPKAIASGMMDDFGWDSSQFSCLETLWEHESGWNPSATNPSSGAYGIPQALPGEKMAAYGDDWRTNPATQIEWGMNYIADRYSTPCGAWSFWQANNWY